MNPRGDRETSRGRDDAIARDERDLAALGYAQQLFREMGGFSNFAISFSIISILTGAVLRGEYATAATAPWSLGRFGPALNAVAVAWIAIIAVVFALPPNELVLWTMLALALALGIYWRVSACARFPGPHAAATRAR
jgi:hypothetical protein